MIFFAATEALFSPPVWLVLPFCLLLLSLACCPLLTPKFWEHHYKKVALLLGAIPITYYLVNSKTHTEYLGVGLDYASFIILIGSLFVVASGIHLQVKGASKPWVNCVYLLIGAVAANLLGTTGASMLFIRPWVRMNKYRYTGFHTVFFIFIVSNAAGCLTPIGDPPLFLGYLKGVPFWWVAQKCWLAWLTIVTLLVSIFYVFDRHNFMRAPKEIRDEETAHEEWRFDGLHNLFFMAMVLIAVISMPGGVREIVMVSAAALSYKTTNKNVHESNHFSFGPIKEVAWIFLGIFATMKPVLDYMILHAGDLGLSSGMQFYWFSGLLSGVLDNAPTYLTFLAAAFGIHGLNLDHPGDMSLFLAQHDHYLVAISLGSVCFGALTYIGNGPNLMVKAICDHAGVHTPHFFDYIRKYSLPVLIPVFILIGLLFI